jgi:hypothetical protein
MGKDSVLGTALIPLRYPVGDGAQATVEFAIDPASPLAAATRTSAGPNTNWPEPSKQWRRPARLAVPGSRHLEPAVPYDSATRTGHRLRARNRQSSGGSRRQVTLRDRTPRLRARWKRCFVERLNRSTAEDQQTMFSLVGRLGLEPRTHGLKVRCSTIELTPRKSSLLICTFLLWWPVLSLCAALLQ